MDFRILYVSLCLVFINMAQFQPCLLVTLCVKLNGTVYCYRSCLCVCIGWALFVCGSVTMITRNCVHRSSPNLVCR